MVAPKEPYLVEMKADLKVDGKAGTKAVCSAG
jgi:hypothetical protein